MTFYHVTLSKNVPKILDIGLLPRIGYYAYKMHEKRRAVWMFANAGDALEMIPAWLEPIYGSKLTILEVNLPEKFPVNTDCDYDVFTYKRIPARCVSVFRQYSKELKPYEL